MRLRDNPVYRLEMRRWRSVLPPGSVARRLVLGGIAIVLTATVFGHSFPWIYFRASMAVRGFVGYVVYPLYFIPSFVPGVWNPTSAGLHRLPELIVTPIADLFYPSNLVAGLLAPLLLGGYVSSLRRRGVIEQLMLTRLKASEFARGAVWARLLPVLVLIVVCYGFYNASPISPIPLLPLLSKSDQSGVVPFYISLVATRVALCAQAIACGYVAVAVSARLARTRLSLPVSLLLCVLCIPAAAYSFGSGIGYRIWDWLNQHGWWTAPFMGAVWRCELLKIGLIFVFYLALWWLAKGAATLEIERLMGTRRVRWRV